MGRLYNCSNEAQNYVCHDCVEDETKFECYDCGDKCKMVEYITIENYQQEDMEDRFVKLEPKLNHS